MASQPPNMPPRCAKCATPAAVPVTPNTSSSAPKRITKNRACIGIGGEINKDTGPGEKNPKAGRQPDKAPHAARGGTGGPPSLSAEHNLGDDGAAPQAEKEKKK